MRQEQMIEIIEVACEKSVECINKKDFSREFNKEDKVQFICLFSDTDSETAKAIVLNLDSLQTCEIEARMGDYLEEKRRYYSN